jgi:putative thioredoxin
MAVPQPAAAADAVIDTTTQTFMKDVIEESKRQPVLIDFWAPWCGRASSSRPIWKRWSRRQGQGQAGQDEHRRPSGHPGQMGIQSIPAVIAFVNGQPADGFMGALPESQVTRFLERLTKGRSAAKSRTC